MTGPLADEVDRLMTAPGYTGGFGLARGELGLAIFQICSVRFLQK